MLHSPVNFVHDWQLIRLQVNVHMHGRPFSVVLGLLQWSVSSSVSNIITIVVGSVLYCGFQCLRARGPPECKLGQLQLIWTVAGAKQCLLSGFSTVVLLPS